MLPTLPVPAPVRAPAETARGIDYVERYSEELRRENAPSERVDIEAYLWCVKMGTGTDTTPPSLCEKGNIPQIYASVGP